MTGLTVGRVSMVQQGLNVQYQWFNAPVAGNVNLVLLINGD